jgi:hypothetical protein
MIRADPKRDSDFAGSAEGTLRPGTSKQPALAGCMNPSIVGISNL